MGWLYHINRWGTSKETACAKEQQKGNKGNRKFYGRRVGVVRNSVPLWLPPPVADGRRIPKTL
jgi:hypothetical protein